MLEILIMINYTIQKALVILLCKMKSIIVLQSNEQI